MTASASAPGKVEPLQRIIIQPSSEDGILNRIETLLPTIRERREEIERARRLPDDVADALRQTGIFTLAVPHAIGGKEYKPTDTMRVIEKIAAADGSVGWCAMIGIANNGVSGYMNEPGAREIFSDPSWPNGGIAAPAGAAVRVEGGLRVSGRWSFASGIAHCRWAWAGCIVMENGKPRMTPYGPEIVHVFFPATKIVIHDTWHVSGLRGTGSNDFSATDVFVPDQHVFALLEPSGHRPEPLYQMPPLTLFTVEVASVSLGVARSALDELAELAQTKIPTFYRQPLAERAVAQVELGKAEAALGGARAFLYNVVEELWDSTCRGCPPTNRQLALARTAATHAAETAAAVTRTAHVLGGGSSIYAGSSLQRHARDAEAITHHFTVAPHTWEQAGRMLLGLDPLVPAF